VKVLIDTHVWLWMLTDPARLGSARELLQDAEVELLLSAVSTWEIAVKYAIGRLPLPEPPSSYVPDRIRSTGVTTLPVSISHTLAVAELPHHHRDPFDRLLIVQARTLGVPIVTADAQLTVYDVEVVITDGP
jgi:PIN domain nuclease of toxin-antitoxin system